MEREGDQFLEPGEINLVDTKSPDGIRLHRFEMVRRGYDPTEVREFLDRVATWYEEQERQLQESERELQEAQLQRDALWGQARKTEEQARRAEEQARRAEEQADQGEDLYSRLGERMAEVLRTADRQAQQLRLEAESEAETRRAEAQSQADEIARAAREDAGRLKREAEEAVEGARSEGQRLLQALSSRRDQVLEQLDTVRRHLRDVEDRLAEGVRSLREGSDIPQAADEPEGAEQDRTGMDSAPPGEYRQDEPFEGERRDMEFGQDAEDLGYRSEPGVEGGPPVGWGEEEDVAVMMPDPANLEEETRE